MRGRVFKSETVVVSGARGKGRLKKYLGDKSAGLGESRRARGRKQRDDSHIYDLMTSWLAEPSTDIENIGE